VVSVPLDGEFRQIYTSFVALIDFLSGSVAFSVDKCDRQSLKMNNSVLVWQ
jgi:hypothetical protein